MKIIIEEIGDHIAISFTGKGKKSDRIKLLMMVMVETLVDGLVSDLTDAQLQDAASIFANEMKTVVIDLSYISITNFDFTDTFTDAVEAKVKAQQEKEKAETDAEKRRVEAQATADADLIAAKAEAEKSKVAADAELYAAQKKAEANDALTDSLDSNLLEYYRITGVDALWDGKLPTYVGGESSVPVLNGLS